MTPTAAKVLGTNAARIELEVVVDAPRDAVWSAIVERPDEWWVPELRCVGDSSVVLDARAGGTLREEAADGSSLLWFTVIAVEPGRSLNLAGSLAPPFGGPASTYLLIRLEDREGATAVSMTNSLHGHVDETMLPEIESGWTMLLQKGLKPVVETGGGRGRA